MRFRLALALGALLSVPVLTSPVLTSPVQAQELALKRVMLSSGGVGYFEYAADVDGTATLGLDVPLGQVDDILKSLVVFDSAGSVVNVELPGRDNTAAAFGDVPFGPEALQSPTDYLNALRGTEVSVLGPKPMTGQIVHAEPLTETTDNISSRRTRVTLLSNDGLRQFVLEDAEAVQVTDPALRERIAKALDALRRDASRTTRHLTLRVKGKGSRVVTVGYVAGAPLWKATYRLVLPAADQTTARMQGWATLENQTVSDWKGVSLTLQYGNPVTFRQALYRSYFVNRPEVPVEILGQVLPDIDTRAIGSVGTAASMVPPPPPSPTPARMGEFAAKAASPGGRGMRPADVMAAPAEAVVAEESAEETIFVLPQPIDLAAGHSANVPIIDRAVPAARIGLVPFGQAHPLASIRIKNDGKQSLPAGVLTLYDGAANNNFAGDARLGGLPVGETRLLSFAKDLRTSVEMHQTDPKATLTALSVANGMLTAVRLHHTDIAFALAAPAGEARELLLEIPKSGGAQKIGTSDPKAPVSEETASAWRVQIKLSGGETRKLTVWLEQPVSETFRLDDDAWDTVVLQMTGLEKLPASVRAALTRIRDLRNDEAAKRAAVDRLRKSVDDVQADEDRIRKNLGVVGQGDALRARLARALDADETKIEQLQKSIVDATALADAAEKTLSDAITGLKI